MAHYRGNKTKEIIFPLGGIGTGVVGFSGNGALRDFEIFNRPDAGSYNGLTFFCLRAEDGDTVTGYRALNSDLLGSYMGTYGCGFGSGPNRGTNAGLPHFKNGDFSAEFPFARLRLCDADFPASVTQTAFNPFIPTDDKDSSLPAAFFSFDITNRAEKALTYTLAFVMACPYASARNTDSSAGGLHGITVTSAGAEGTPAGGNITISTDSPDGGAQVAFYRGEWMDGITTFIHDFTHNKRLCAREYPDAGRDTGAVYASVRLEPGQKATLRFLLAWYNPVCERYWRSEQGQAAYTWKNYYATLFDGSASVTKYCFDNWEQLKKRSEAFSRALYSSSVDEKIIDAAASNLCVLKNTTVLRLEDGSLWGWEGTHEKVGSCEGTCSHVWSYAYALCFLFPGIERTMRDTEYRCNMTEDGLMRFRTPIPVTIPVTDDDRPCLDGQMCEVIKTCREWKLSGDKAWLEKYYPAAKKALAFAWSQKSAWRWDRNRDGVLEGRQHHTLDMELFGPSSWLQGLYIAALRAAAQMADALGDGDAKLFRELADKGAAYMEKELFNGKYYFQKIDLTDEHILDEYPDEARRKYWNSESGELKYQIGEGCAEDQMLAQFHAALCGLGDIFDRTHRRTAMKTLFANNYLPTMRNTANLWRLYALNDEAGTRICSFPEGARAPVIPLPYADECMHGFEYAFAGILFADGFYDEGIKVVAGVRDRYDGEKRNPFNEMECGAHYARSMASFGLLPILAGFTFDMQENRIGFCPVRAAENGRFACVFGAGDAFGQVKADGARFTLRTLEGKITLAELDLPDDRPVASLLLNGKAARFVQNGRRLSFEKTALHSLKALYGK